MEFTAFTLEQATDVCEDFEDLIDTEFRFQDSMLLADDVVICPFPDADKETFTARYLEMKAAKESLDFYTGGEYDVMLVASDENSRYSFIDIRTFALEKGITYRFPE